LASFIYLFKDVARAPGIGNKFLYIFMPPGWSHTGNHKTAKLIRKNYLENLQAPVAVTVTTES